MKDTQSHFYHENQNRRQNWRIDQWLLEHGVRSRDFDTHPCIDDIVSLLNIRESLWGQMSRSDQATWGVYWGLVFKNKKHLKPKAWKKFQKITETIIDRQQKINTIRATQQSKNIGHDMTAKGPCLPQSMLVKGELQECREDQDFLPWY